MKTALFKDFLREIKTSFGRFFSIFAIVGLGVAFFVGIKVSVPVMKYSANHYYEENNLYDIQLLSTIGFQEAEVTALKELPELYQVEAIHTMDLLVHFNGSEQVFKAMGLTKENKINQSTVIKGRLPNHSKECAVEETSLKNEIKIGDNLDFSSGTTTPISASLKTTSCTVVGLIRNPLYLSFQKGSSQIGSGKIDSFLILPEEDFVSDFFTEINLTVTGAEHYHSYHDDYFDFLKPIKATIEPLLNEMLQTRYQTTRETLLTTLEQVKHQLALVPSMGPEKEMLEQQKSSLEETLQTISEPTLYVLDRKSNYSYLDYESAADRMNAIAQIFPLFFLAVAALVCLTTMSRMVEEERSQLGIYKALGYSSWAIAFKYLMYAFSASFLGGVVGSILGSIIFPTIIYHVWNIMYALPPVHLVFEVPLMILSVLVVVFVTVLTTLYSVSHDRKEVPAALMRPKAPTVGKKILLERISFFWRPLTFLQKVTARNLFRYKKRFFMTVVGISGCTALLVAGFGIRDSVSSIVPKQFGEIFKYDALIHSNGEELDSTALLEQKELIRHLPVYESAITIGDRTADLFVPSDNDISQWFDLHTRVSKKPLPLTEEGVILTEKLAKQLNVAVGDTIKGTLNGTTAQFQVSGIAEHYVGHYLYLSKKSYEQAYGPYQPNTWLVKLQEGTDETLLGNQLLQLPTVRSVTFYTGLAENFEHMVSSLSTVTIVLLISAGLLAFIVLYNLTNVNLSERIREIATIQVLGFYPREVDAYVFRENIILTVFGSLLGLGLGVILHHFIMQVAELDTIMFGRTIYLGSYVLSFLITMLFTWLVNLVMHQKLKRISMVESLKGVE